MHNLCPGFQTIRIVKTRRVESAGMLNCNPTATPMEASWPAGIGRQHGERRLQRRDGGHVDAAAAAAAAARLRPTGRGVRDLG